MPMWMSLALMIFLGLQFAVNYMALFFAGIR